MVYPLEHPAFPRSISIESFIANSVGYRCRKMESYRPDNLVISGGSLDSAYQIEEVIPEDALVDSPADADRSDVSDRG